MSEILRSYSREKVEIIAEAGCNHAGDIDRATEMVRQAVTCGADTIKFQLFKTDQLINPGEQVKDFCRKSELSCEDCAAIMEECELYGINCLFSVFDLESLEMAKSLDVTRVKIPSGQVFNDHLLSMVASSGLDVVMSTGMCSEARVNAAFRVLLEYGLNPSQISILQCTTSYPAPFTEANLLVIPRYLHELQTKIGYSDHTIGWSVSVGAVALGASIIEKHFILNPDEDMPDAPVSLHPVEFRMMVQDIRNVSLAMGCPVKHPCKSERKMFKRRDYRRDYGGQNET